MMVEANSAAAIHQRRREMVCLAEVEGALKVIFELRNRGSGDHSIESMALMDVGSARQQVLHRPQFTLFFDKLRPAHGGFFRLGINSIFGSTSATALANGDASPVPVTANTACPFILTRAKRVA